MKKNAFLQFIYFKASVHWALPMWLPFILPSHPVRRSYYHAYFIDWGANALTNCPRLPSKCSQNSNPVSILVQLPDKIILSSLCLSFELVRLTFLIHRNMTYFKAMWYLIIPITDSKVWSLCLINNFLYKDLDQWFSTRCDFCLTKKHSAMPGNIFGCHTWWRGAAGRHLEDNRGEGAQDSPPTHTTNNNLAPSVSNAKVGEC